LDLEWAPDAARCSRCEARFPFEEGVPKFHDLPPETTRDAAFQSDQMLNRSWTAKLFNLGKRIVNSEYSRRDFLADALALVPAGGVVVELGSGNRRLRDDVIDIDRFRFPNVDVMADVVAVPIRDDSVDLVILDSLLEHVADPREVVAEARRMLRPGGVALALIPFLFPYHGYPRHYWNFSKDGAELLFAGFSRCEIEPALGPTSALTNLLSEYVAVAASGTSSFAYTVFKGLALLPIFLLKYLDALWPAEPALRMASMLCVTARK